MEPGSWKKWLGFAGLGLAWVVITLLLIHLYNSNTGLPANQRLTERLYELEQQNEALSLENKRLWDEIRYRKSTTYHEEMVRTELRYVKDGETLYLLPTPTPSPQQSIDQ